MSKALATKNVAAVLLAVAMVFGFAFSFAAPVKADAVSDLQAQVQALLAQIQALQGSNSGGACVKFTFTTNLKQGASNAEVMQVQKFLNQWADTRVSVSGAGSVGNETSYFGPATKAAVIKFQNKYAADILTPVGLSAGNGNWFASTRAKANALAAACVPGSGGNTGGNTGGGTTTGGNLVVGASTQPANSLAPESAARVPFTNFTLTNTSNAAVTVTGVTVQRTGLANDAVFSGLVLVDETGIQIGNSKTLNSNHQAVVGDTFTINPGQTKTLTVAGNMASNLDAYSGQIVGISVVGINTSGTVSGSLPITGASQTINSTLAVGTLSASLGSADLNAAQTSQAIGVTGLTGASVRVTAGSAEEVWVKSVRWNQSGSAASSDIANVVTVVDGTSYPTTPSADGKYYTSIFPGNGIQIGKGLNKELIVKFDTVGGPNRTVNFDIYKNTDINAVGATFGYGITTLPSANTASASTAASEFVTSDGAAVTTSSSNSVSSPFYSGSTFTISAGTFTSLSRANEAAAQNITIVSPNQTLGGFAMDVKGEGITVGQQIYYFTYSSGAASSNLLTSVSLVDANGVVVAGPVDAANVGGTNQKVTFSNSVTFPTGRHVYTLKGQLPSTVSNGVTIQASTTPSTDWSSVTGQSTGNSISLSALSTAVTGNVMTVRSGAVALSIAGTPAAQTMVTGVSGATVSAIQFDATQSGEDVKFTSIKLAYTDSSMTGGDISNCFVYDGATRLNDTAVSPTTGAPTDYTFTLSAPLTVTKGTVKTVSVKCDIPSSISSGSFSIGFTSPSSVTTFTGTGVASSQTITPTSSTGGTQAGNTMTIATGGTLSVAKDSSSPSYAIAAAGTTGVTLGTLRFTSTNEALSLTRVALQMSNSAASSSPNNLTQVTIWDGGTQVGTAIFAGTRFATSTLSSTVTIPANSFKVLTVKGDLATIGTGAAGTEGALIQVDYDNGDSTGTQAVGASSGATISRTTSADSAVDGVRVFKSYPTFAQVAGGGTLTTATGVVLDTFTVTANAAGDVGIYKFVINVATSSGSAVAGTTTVSNLKVYAYTSSGATVSGYTDGQVVATIASLVSGDNDAVLSAILQVPAGQTYTFKVKGDTTLTAGTGTFTGNVTTKVLGDSAYPTFGTLMSAAATVDGDASDNFIWSPNATTTAVALSNDWTNGYGVPGLPSAGLNGTVWSK